MSYMAFTGGQSVGNIKFMCEIHLEIRGFAFSEEVDFPREISFLCVRLAVRITTYCEDLCFYFGHSVVDV